jgi:hypothetical protein
MSGAFEIKKCFLPGERDFGTNLSHVGKLTKKMNECLTNKD